MKRDLSVEERAMITKFVASGDRIEATSSYISITGCGLTQAQEFIRGIKAEVEAKKSAKDQKK
jgi:hypothetical protein